MKVWIVPAGEAYDVGKKRRPLVELPAPLEIPESQVELVRRSPPNRFLSFQSGGRRLEVDVARCTLLTIDGDAHPIVQDVEYGSW